MSFGNKLGSVLSSIEKDFGDTIFIGDLPEKAVLRFTSPYLNYLLRGGIREGVSTEIVGEEHSGKSTLVLDLIKNYQQQEAERYKKEKARLEEELKNAKGKRAIEDLEKKLEELIERPAVYLDIEQTLDPQWIHKMGVDESKVIIYKPSAVGMEEPLDHILLMLETGQVGFVAIDSIGQMISTAEHDSELGKGNYGGIAKSLTKYYKKAIPLVSRNKVYHVVVNQTREDLSGYNQLVRPGGKAHAFSQSMVLRLRPGKRYNEAYATISKSEALVHARSTVVQVEKNKMSGSDRQATEFTIRPNYGIDKEFDLVQMAIELGIIDKGGAWYTIFDPTTGEQLDKVQGIARVMEYIEENEEYTKTIDEYIYNKSLED